MPNPNLNPDFQIIDRRLIGKGTQGTVYLARIKDGDSTKQLVVKVSNDSIKLEHDISVAAWEALGKERTTNQTKKGHIEEGTLVEANHSPKIMDFSNNMLFMEYFPLGDLTKKPNLGLDPYNILKQLFKVVSILHKNNIFHRDIKLENIFLKDGKIVLADYGAARRVYTPEIDPLSLTELTGTNVSPYKCKELEKIYNKILNHPPNGGRAKIAYGNQLDNIERLGDIYAIATTILDFMNLRGDIHTDIPIGNPNKISLDEYIQDKKSFESLADSVSRDLGDQELGGILK